MHEPIVEKDLTCKCTQETTLTMPPKMKSSSTSPLNYHRFQKTSTSSSEWMIKMSRASTLFHRHNQLMKLPQLHWFHHKQMSLISWLTPQWLKMTPTQQVPTRSTTLRTRRLVRTTMEQEMVVVHMPPCDRLWQWSRLVSLNSSRKPSILIDISL